MHRQSAERAFHSAFSAFSFPYTFQALSVYHLDFLYIIWKFLWYNILDENYFILTGLSE